MVGEIVPYVKVPTKRRNIHTRTSHAIAKPEAIDYLRIRHLGLYFTEPYDYQEASVCKLLHYIPSVGLLKG